MVNEAPAEIVEVVTSNTNDIGKTINNNNIKTNNNNINESTTLKHPEQEVQQDVGRNAANPGSQEVTPGEGN